jgi:hypothetical protein
MEGDNALVVVRKDWFDQTLYPLFFDTPSGSTTNAHVLSGRVEDTNDLRGLWMQDVVSRDHKTDGSPVILRLMIPWEFILTVGVVADDKARLPTGFSHATGLSAPGDRISH